MTAEQPIEFWFDFASPYAWLASAQIDALGARCGRAVVWRPMLLGVVFRETGMTPLADQPMRGAYARRDVARLAHRLGLPFATVFAPIGVSLTLGRIFYAIAQAAPAEAPRFARAAFEASFGRGEDLSDVAAARAFARRLGPAAGEAAEASEAQAARAGLREATAEAIRRGIFGAPFFLVGDEPFWGQDRMPLLESWLKGE
ncbi:2-hydroxychromene-2-carboxylate isomerase [Plastoroseomonas hellenica]|uniref:2-hydroxychromene-2-carboxylate isomerase n=1 Tax=Plastoroseomonas hellenica TaxID=2687306 RepID=UPI001BA472E5|nr:2-hydroxychromene-2-carboxylate isomerase [Plastoroseomonas hellenica]MBR0641655.1 2-hydroxychromene-2-carboxylate isomerase [Plastoroseomonas hellenica]